MSRSSFHSRAGLAALAITMLVASLVAAAVLAVNWTEKGHPLDLLAVVLPAAGFVAALVIWAKRPTAPSGPLVADVKAAAEILASIVEQQWLEEARHRLVDDPEPIPVHWQLIADQTVMSQPHLITTVEELTLTGSSNDIAALADAFRDLTRRRLVVTGGAGMGKTTLAIQLLLHLLSTRAADQTGASEGEIVPVPVLLPVSGWDTGAHPRLQDWLAVRLAQDYPALAAPQLGAGAAAALAEGGHILPVLDGLDEISAPARAQVIAALNASLTARDQLILTSRRTEFTTAIHETGRPLTAAAVIVPKPVTPQAAADYLTDCLAAAPSPAWTQTLAALRSRTVPGLTRLAATPLGLWLIRTVYLTPGANPAPLTGPLGRDANALRTHLLDRLIPALIQARPPSTDPADHFRPRHRLDPATAVQYLTYLAHVFPPTTTRDIAWWRIASTTSYIRATIALVVGFVVELVVGLVHGIVIGFQAGFTFDTFDVESGIEKGIETAIHTWTGGGIWISLFIALWLGLFADWSNEMPGYANLGLRGRTVLLLRSIKAKFGFWFVNWLTGGFIYGFVSGLTDVITDSADPLWSGLTVGLPVGLIAGLAFALGLGLVEWAEQPTPISISTPGSSWQASKALILLQVLAGGFTVGLLFVFLVGVPIGFVVWFEGGLEGALRVGLPFAIYGAIMGLVLGLIAGKHHAWLACTIAVVRLALRHRLPWRIMDFLDDAHRLGLLRAVGPVYQFRHAALHDHLASASGRQHPPLPARCR